MPRLTDEAFAQRLARRIEAKGPISVAAFMRAANAHYYATRDPLGRDFVTAPEISQMFGELVGAALTDAWVRAGSPADAIYAELGPGRGTLAADALRVMRRFGCAPAVHLVETSPTLHERQATAVPGATFHDRIETLPAAPLLLVANEFFDALPVEHYVATGEGWRRMMVEQADGVFVPHPGGPRCDAKVPAGMRDAEPGTIVERAPAAAGIARTLGRHLARHGGVALIIDYGHDTPRAGATLQAVKGHEKVPAFADPGSRDLTAHVDFAALAETAGRAGAQSHGPVGQGAWLQALGIDARAEKLGQQAERDRLIAPDQMGELFRVLGLSGPGWGDVAGL